MALLMHVYTLTWHLQTPPELQNSPCQAADLHEWVSTCVQEGVCVHARHGKYALKSLQDWDFSCQVPRAGPFWS